MFAGWRGWFASAANLAMRNVAHELTLRAQSSGGGGTPLRIWPAVVTPQPSKRCSESARDTGSRSVVTSIRLFDGAAAPRIG